MERSQGVLAWICGSAALMVVGAFGPWVNALGISVSGTDGSNDGWFVVAAAAFGAVLFYAGRERRSGAVWPFLAGAAGVAVTLYDRQNVQNAINQGGTFAQALAHVGWGLNLALLASASMAVAALASKASRQKPSLNVSSPTPPPTSPPPSVSDASE